MTDGRGVAFATTPRTATQCALAVRRIELSNALALRRIELSNQLDKGVAEGEP
jgi:hypothetical protein